MPGRLKRRSQADISVQVLRDVLRSASTSFRTASPTVTRVQFCQIGLAGRPAVSTELPGREKNSAIRLTNLCCGPSSTRDSSLSVSKTCLRRPGMCERQRIAKPVRVRVRACPGRYPSSISEPHSRRSFFVDIFYVFFFIIFSSPGPTSGNAPRRETLCCEPYLFLLTVSNLSRALLFLLL
jgi:hypothetical protein